MVVPPEKLIFDFKILEFMYYILGKESTNVLKMLEFMELEAHSFT